MNRLVTPLDDGFEQRPWVARNRPGLGRIDYSADDHAALRQRLRQRLPAVLPGWNATLASDDAGFDFATLITDLAALMLANLAAHADQRANESLLRTATTPRALIDLAALAGLRPGAGASAATVQVFELKDGGVGTLAAGTRLSFTTAERQELIFETAAALAVDASRNAMRHRGWDRSARTLRLRRQTADEQDLTADVDGEFAGLRAGQPLVLRTPTSALALPLAAVATLGEGAARSTRLRWAAGAAPHDDELPIADLEILGRARQVAQLADAARADELPAGSHHLELVQAGAFAAGDVALLHSGGLRLGVRITARGGGTVSLGRALPVALRRSQTELYAARWCGQSRGALRAGLTALPRWARAAHEAYPHTPGLGDLLLLEHAAGVELASVADVSDTQILLAEPLARTLQPVPYAHTVGFVTPLGVHFHALDPGHAGTVHSRAAPVLLRDLPGVFDGSGTLLELDRACDALLAGSEVVVTDGLRWHADQVDHIDTVDRRSRVRLVGTAPAGLQAARVTVHGAFEHRMRVAGWNRSEARLQAGATEIEIDGAPAGLAAGLQLVLGDGAGAEAARVARVESVPGRAACQRVSLARATERSYALATLQIHGNVAAVSHGAGDRDEIVGSANPQLAPQRFMLRRSPLAQVPDASSPSGMAPALQVFVGGRLWQRVDSLAASGPLDAHYALEIDERQRAWLRFGDGVHGAPPPSGRDNVTARYRVGLGRGGNLEAGRLVKMVAPPAFVARSFNPLPAGGGADPDGPAATRERVMRHMRTLDRAVTLADHAELARAFGGVAAARADWFSEGTGAGARRLLCVTVAGTDGLPLTAPQRDALLGFLAARSAEPQRLRVRAHRRWPVRLALQVGLHADFTQAAVLARLQQVFGAGRLDDGTPAFFAFERRPLGQALVLSDVYRIAEAVAGVDHVQALAFHAEAAPAAVDDRITVPDDAQASGGHAQDATIGRFEAALQGGLPT